jgi:hypothetical protein
MSTLSQQAAVDPNSVLYYAPRRLRELNYDAPSILPGVDDEPALRLQPDANDPPDPRTSIEPDPDHYRVELPLPQSLQHLFEPDRDSRSAILERRSFRRRLAFVIVASVVTAFGIALEVAFLDATQWQDAAVDAPLNNKPAPISTVAKDSTTTNAPLPFDIYVTNDTRDADIFPGTTVSTGVTLAMDQWQLASSDLPEILVTPPPHQQPYSNSGKAAKLQTPSDDATTDDKGAKRVVSVRQMNPDEAASLLKRAEDLVLSGDLPSARLLLRRLADAHNARAAFDLAGTYDPGVIKALGAVSVSPDRELARTWYERAREWGSPSASEKLQALANAGG